ncbi:hypothetical protein PO909_016552 [Leuciscus waleckii]
MTALPVPLHHRQPPPANDVTEMLLEPTADSGDRPPARDEPVPRIRMESVIATEPGPPRESDQVREPVTQYPCISSVPGFSRIPAQPPSPASSISQILSPASAYVRQSACTFGSVWLRLALSGSVFPDSASVLCPTGSSAVLWISGSPSDTRRHGSTSTISVAWAHHLHPGLHR